MRITQSAFLWQVTPKPCRYWDSFLSSQPLSFQTHSFNGFEDPTVSRSWEPEMPEDCLSVVWCCICLFCLVVQSVCEWCSSLSQLAGLPCELAGGTQVLTGSPDFICFKLPWNVPPQACLLQRQQGVYSWHGFTHWKPRLEPLIQVIKLIAFCLPLCIQVGLASQGSIGNSCLPPDKFRAWVLSGCFCYKTGPGHRYVYFHIYTHTQTMYMSMYMCIYTHMLSPEQLISYKAFSQCDFLFGFLMAYVIRKAIN